jgi:hypothetical protein
MADAFRKESWALCINSEGFHDPRFDLTEGKLYLVHDVRAVPSLFSKDNIKLVFIGDDGESKIEINARRFKKMDNN